MTGFSDDAATFHDKRDRPRAVWWAVTSSVLIVAAVTGYALSAFDSVPDPMPVHWGFDGQADAWKPKDLSDYVLTVLLGPVLVLITQLGTVALMRGMREPTGNTAGMPPADAAARTHMLARGQMVVVAWMLTALVAVVAVPAVAAATTSSLSRYYLPVFVAAMLALIIGLAVGLDRVYKRADAAYPLTNPGAGHPKWGLLWYEPGGPAMHANTAGTNWTPNVANPRGRIIALVLLGTPMLLLAALAIYAAIA